MSDSDIVITRVNFYIFLTFLVRSLPHVLRNTSIMDKPDGNLSLVINIKTSATTRTLIVLNDISNQ